MDKIRKHSRKRDAILACLRSTTSHPTAEWIYQQLKPDIPALSLGTVYRNLTMFREEGIIRSLGTINGMERFDFNTMPHAHFVCCTCHAVIDVQAPPVPPAVRRTVEDALHARVQECDLTFTGVCQTCCKHPDGCSNHTM